MGALTPREEQLSAALQSAKAMDALLEKWETQPERISEMELAAVAGSFARGATRARNSADSAAVLVGVILTIAATVSAVVPSFPGLIESALPVWITLAAAFVVALSGLVLGFSTESRAEGVLRRVEMFRVRRERCVMEMSRTRRSRRDLVALQTSAAPA